MNYLFNRNKILGLIAGKFTVGVPPTSGNFPFPSAPNAGYYSVSPQGNTARFIRPPAEGHNGNCGVKLVIVFFFF